MLCTKMALLVALLANGSALHMEPSVHEKPSSHEKPSVHIEGAEHIEEAEGEETDMSLNMSQQPARPRCECLPWGEAYETHFQHGCDHDMGPMLCKHFFMRVDTQKEGPGTCLSEFGRSKFKSDTRQFCLVDMQCEEETEKDPHVLALKGMPLKEGGNWLAKKWCKEGQDKMMKNKTFPELMDMSEKQHLDIAILVKMAYPTVSADTIDHEKLFKKGNTDMSVLAEHKARASEAVKSENFVLDTPSILESPMYVVTKCGDYQISGDVAYLNSKVSQGIDPWDTAELLNVATPVEGSMIDSPECQLERP